MKRILYILGIVVLAGIFLVAGVILRNRFSGAPSAPAGSTVEIPAGGLPSSPLGGTSAGVPTSPSPATGGRAIAPQTSDSGILAYAILANGDLLYVRPDGQIVRRSSSSSTLVSTRKISGVLDASFSYDGRRALIKAGPADNPRWSVFDTQKNAWRQLTLDARDAYWSPADYRIAYFSRKTSSASLNTLDLAQDSSRPRTFLTLNGEDMDLDWGGTNYIFFGERGSALVSAKVWRLDLKSGGVILARDSVYGARLAWGKNYGLLFHTFSGGYGGTLSLVNFSGADAKKFSFTTLPSKCSFFSPATSTTELLACAVPNDSRGFSTATEPEAYEKGAVATADNFYILNPESGTYVPVRDATALGIDAKNLRVIGDKIYFLDRAMGKIYSAGLPDYSAVLNSSPVGD